MLFFFQCLIVPEMDRDNQPYGMFIAIAVSVVVLPAIALIIGVTFLLRGCTSKPNRVGRAKVHAGQWRINK